MRVNQRTKFFIKVLGINFAIFGILLISPAILFRLYTNLKPRFSRSINQTSDQRAFYPTYSNKKFSIELFNELGKTSFIYKSFIGWRRREVNFKYTTILSPYNVRKSKGHSVDNSVWFFGGSTMWGTGASDLQTIPSHFNSLTKNSVYNFAEADWNSRQSLNQLINALGDEHIPSVVIFYDGVNDVANQCRKEFQSLPIHSRERVVQNALEPYQIKRYLKFFFSPYIDFAKRYNLNLKAGNRFNSKFYDCDTNKAKSLSIAQHLVNNWYTAYSLSRSKGFEFYGILQPNLFTTKTNSEYLVSSEVESHSELEKQYKIVYPLILKEIERKCKYNKEFCASIINGTDWLNGTNNVFIDFCHINSLGNKVIAKRLKSLLEK